MRILLSIDCFYVDVISSALFFIYTLLAAYYTSSSSTWAFKSRYPFLCQIKIHTSSNICLIKILMNHSSAFTTNSFWFSPSCDALYMLWDFFNVYSFHNYMFFLVIPNHQCANPRKFLYKYTYFKFSKSLMFCQRVIWDYMLALWVVLGPLWLFHRWFWFVLRLHSSFLLSFCSYPCFGACLVSWLAEALNWVTFLRLLCAITSGYSHPWQLSVV